MPNADSGMIEATTIDLFSRMNSEEIDYAVLRNYELYPKFGHDIDMVVRWRDLPRWRAVAKSCALDHGWSALTECGHWARSASQAHTIQILRFYSENPLQYLQTDTFHSHLVLGLPLFDEDALLRERIKDERGFYRIDERMENFCRLLAIAPLIGYNDSDAKVNRYSERALSFWNNSSDLPGFAASLGFPNMPKALERLVSGDLPAFKKEVDRQKRAWLIKRAFPHPFHAGKMIWDRCGDYLRLFWLRPCGFNLRAFACDQQQRASLERILKRLTEASVITHFTLSRDFKPRQRVRERGGIVVDWAPAESADIRMDCLANEQSVMSAILKLIIKRHASILDQRTV